MEGMFLINVTPLNIHKTLMDYCKILMNRFLLTEFRKGCYEIHVISDNPGALGQSPKIFEQNRRDKLSTQASNHYCDDLLASTKITSKQWREKFLNCRECKRRLVKFLGNYLLYSIEQHLQGQQVLYVAGCFEGNVGTTTWYVQSKGKPQPDPKYNSNAEETNTRVWLHATKTYHTNIAIMSPDTDVYHIGLPLLCTINKEVVVILSAVTSRELKVIHLGNFIKALQNDPDFAGTNADKIPKVMQTLYISTGCDYISFFSHIGKSTFLKYFYQYNGFIIAGTNPKTPGTLAETDQEIGFLAFLRLIGTVYF